MYILAFDTTVNFCSVGLFNNDKELCRLEKEMEFGQAEALIPQIQSVLESESLQFKNLGLAVVCTGPGSFTGVRSSIAAARAFALACPQVAVAGITAFDAYAADFTADEISQVNTILIETKRDDFYVQFYNQAMQKIAAPQAMTYEDIIRYISNKKVTLSGDGVERFLNKPSGLSLHAVKTPLTPPLAKLAWCGLNAYRLKKIDFPKPLYLKAPDVCLK